MRRPDTISTKERIFLITNFDNETFICNLRHIQLQDLEQIKKLKHMWNFNWEQFGKDDLKEMIIYRDKPSKAALEAKLYELTGEDSMEAVLDAIETIDNNYETGKVASMKEGFAGGRVVSDKYAQWLNTKAEVESIINQIKQL